MLKNRIKTPGLLLYFLLMALAAQAQYRVVGGKGTPMLAADDSRNRLQVYMVHDVGGVEISYTSSSTSHQWYRYRNSRQDAQPIPSTQQGTTSTIQHVEEGYGYYVAESAIIQERYIWIIDYAKHPFTLSTWFVSDKGNPCSSVLLEGEAVMDRLSYFPPSGGADIKVEREFEIAYNTLEWQEEPKRFTPKEATETVNSPFVSLDAPLCDTDFRLKGDQFARHFGLEKKHSTGPYQAVAIELHTSVVYVDDESGNLATGKEGLSAPITARFDAVANDPVAALYIWTIYKDIPDRPDGAEIDPIIRFTGESVEYTFQEAGSFIARLEVSDRTGACSEQEEISLQVSESALDVPNAFSPGTTPGINDEFKVVYKSLVRFKATVFNRWGAQLYQWTNPAEGWDGKVGGKYAPSGVYFYVIEAVGSDGITYKKSGDINLLRPKTIEDQIHE